MKHSLFKCAVVGGIIVFAVNFLAWKAMPGAHPMHFQNEAAVAKAVKENAPKDGVYVMRACTVGEPASHMPYMLSVVRLHGKHCLTSTMIIALVSQMILAGLIMWLLMHTKALSFKKKVAFITMAGVIIGFSAFAREFNWVGLPLGCALFCFFDIVVAWFIAGLAMVKLSK